MTKFLLIKKITLNHDADIYAVSTLTLYYTHTKKRKEKKNEIHWNH